MPGTSSARSARTWLRAVRGRLEPAPPTARAVPARPRILMVTKSGFDEPRDGGTLRVAAVRQQLRAAGFDVDAFAVRDHPRPSVGRPGPGDVAATLRVLLRFARVGSLTTAAWFSPRLVRDVRRCRRGADHVAALVEYSQLLAYLPLLPRPVVCDMHNVESELMRNYAGSAGSRARRWAARWEAARIERLERRMSGLVDGVAAVSPHDAGILDGWARERRDPTPVVVATNGVVDAAFDAEGPRADTVVFVAQLGWRPNVDAAVWLAHEVWPRVVARRPGLRLQLVGRSPAPEVQRLAGPGVEVHPDVPDVLPFVTAARAATAPLLAAGGTRLKILEALACGTPVVATPLGAMGLEQLAGAGLRISQGAEAFADALVRAVDQDVPREEVRAGVQPYRWTHALRPLTDLLQELATPAADGSTNHDDDSTEGVVRLRSATVRTG